MPETTRLVIDTNVLVSRLIFRQSIAAQAVRQAMAASQLIISSETLLELETVLFQPKFNTYVPLEDRLQFLYQLQSTAVLVEDIPVVMACRDPKDDKFLALAAAGHANLILTGDQDLLTMNPFRGISILSPRQYLDQYSQIT